MSSFNSILRKLGLTTYVPTVFTHHHDPDLGEFTFYSGTGMWSVRKDMDGTTFQICGRSSSPSPEQKRLLGVFLPRLGILTGTAVSMLRPPDDSSSYILPDTLVLRELRLEFTGNVQLFFDPELEVDGYAVWPMATCSPDATLLSVEWVP